MNHETLFTGRYARYKRGTEQVLKWLATTASRCCDISQMVVSLQSSKEQQSATKEATVELRTVELPKLARAIASARPPIEIPKDILQLLERVIDDRQQCAHMYKSDSLNAHGEISQDDKTHQHFIDVLQHVFGIIQPPPSEVQGQCKVVGNVPKKSKRKGQSEKASTSAPIHNVFSELSVEEPIEYEDTIPESPKTTPTIDLSKASFKLHKQEEHRRLALWCHLQDLNDVREYVRKIWLQFSRGEVSSLMASMTTEVAFALLRCADNEFGALEPSLDSYAKIVSALRLKVVPADNHSACYIVNSSNDAVTYDPALMDLLCPHGASMVQVFSAITASVTRNLVNHKYGRPREPDPPKIDCWRQCHSFAQAMAESILNILSTATAHRRADQFAAGLDEVYKTNVQPTWVVVACETYLDVFNVIGPSAITTGLDRLENALGEFADTFDMLPSLLEKYVDTKSTGEWFRGASSGARKASTLLSLDTPAYDRGDAFDPAFKKQREKVDTMRAGVATGLERRFPVSAGASTYYSKTTLTDVGCNFANTALVVHSVAYLYKALRLLGLISCD